MARRNTPEEDVEALNRRMNAPEDKRRRRTKADMDAATWPASGAPVHRARVGAEFAGEDQESETGKAIKRAAENHRRV